MKNYKNEARSRWGDTEAYREHEQKTKNYTKEKWAEANDGLIAILWRLSKITSRKKIATASCLSMPTAHGIIKS